jgi:F-type H+-transporting ATPase subunit epsilon
VKLSILSPERRLLEGTEIQSVTLPSSEGQIQIMPGHAKMVGVLEIGVFAYQPVSGAEHTGFITAGFFEVRGEDVFVMAETLELRGEIDVDRARRAQKDAEDALRDAALDQHKFQEYQLKLQRALIRQQLAAKEH